MVNTRHHRKTHIIKRRPYVNNKTRKHISGSIIVGVIHAHWCGHCQVLMPKWKVFKNELKHNKNITIIDIEDGDPKKSVKMNNLNMKINDKSVRLNADGFPTIFKIQHGNLEYYTGAREPADLKQWVLSSKKPISKNELKPVMKKPSSFFGLF